LALGLASLVLSTTAAAQGITGAVTLTPVSMRSQLRTLLPSSSSMADSLMSPCALPKFVLPFEGPLHFRSAYRAPRAAAAYRSCPSWSTFGTVRSGSRFHGGVDISAPTGTPLRAAADGILTYARDPGGYGLFARIDIDVPKRSDDGTCTSQTTTVQVIYGHLLDDDRRLNMAPKTVRAGDLIGRVGCSGNARGMCSPSPESHVHITVQHAHGNKTKLEPTAFLGWNVAMPADATEVKESVCREIPTTQLASLRSTEARR